MTGTLCTPTDLARPEVAGHAAALLAIDTTNTGGVGTVGERGAADYVAGQLSDAGGSPLLFEPEPDRTSVVLRVPGRRPGPGTVVHGHLDVVPADPAEWSVDPFGGTVRDGCVWGRGAVDMKGADAVMLTVALNWLREGRQPDHDVVFAWLADEEAGGALGAGFLTGRHPELFADCATAIGEVGGFGIPLGRAGTLYPVMTGERGQVRVTLTARGRSGHASVATADNPIAVLAAAVAALAGHRFPLISTASLTGFLGGVEKLWGQDFSGLPTEVALARIGGLRALVEPAARASANPTLLAGGTAFNVSPTQARATFDCRVLPGGVADFAAALPDIVGAGVRIEVEAVSPGVESPFDGPFVAAAAAALRAADPTAVTVPYMVSASTDAPHFARLGLRTYGFTPLRLPVGFPFGRLFHGPDERVPIDGLVFGVDVLDTVLTGL